eukprot:SAG11_NODE_16152_length_555_cov_3.140351_1_plen_21_part_10
MVMRLGTGNFLPETDFPPQKY